MVELEEFQRLDLRVGVIVKAEEIKGSEKLLRLEVDIGEVRQVVAGIKPWYRPEELIGKRVILLANMRPARIFGFESRGMVLAAQGEKALALLTPDKDIEKGTRL
ncbi:MAG: methionine--tRNA ligase subunit beta [Candidatus Hydrothermarchaeota archaeon]